MTTKREDLLNDWPYTLATTRRDEANAVELAARMKPTVHQIRWRLNDPAEEWRVRWTKVHRVSLHADDLTACHIVIPELPYDAQRDDWIPADAPRCKRCEHPDHREA